MSAPAMLGRVAAARAATLRAAGADSAAARDVDVFRQALQAPLPGSVLKPGRTGSALQELTDALSRNRRSLARQIEQVQTTRDPASIVKITNELVDQGVQNDLIAKVVGKTVSAVDQLTKLS
ncbi:EscI/YscI/HrpB family type III secretion system inner rod protein [Pseudoduganella sp. R-34]|uniref:EscI/YscI/HrpB family type III secretion system inner rod protein n=1 Tax=Pseudoduganella sp. R-34 TaxID=3404062 RepID=UPI003CF014DA